MGIVFFDLLYSGTLGIQSFMVTLELLGSLYGNVLSNSYLVYQCSHLWVEPGKICLSNLIKLSSPAVD
jgi:hypothetical protein